jgi:drug/metabolite transporter (DMT)-like permease
MKTPTKMPANAKGKGKAQQAESQAKKKPGKGKLPAIAQGTVMSVIIGLQYIFLKDIIGKFDNHVLTLLSVRFAIALVPMLFMLKGFKSRTLLTKGILALCLVQPGLNLVAQTYAAMLSDVTMIAYLTALSPVSMHIAARITMKEKAKPPLLFFMGLAIAGSILASTDSDEMARISLAGVLLTLACLALRSVFSVLAKKESQNATSPKDIAIAQVIWGFVAFTALALLIEGPQAYASAFSKLSAADIWPLAYLGAFSITVAYTLNNLMLDSLSVTMSGVLNNLTFLTTLLSGVIFLKEPFAWQGIVGSVLIVVGVYASAVVKAKGQQDGKGGKNAS